MIVLSLEHTVHMLKDVESIEIKKNAVVTGETPGI